MNNKKYKKAILSVGLAFSLLLCSGVSALKAEAASNYKTITIKKGDTLYGLSKKYNTTVSKLKNLNNLHSNLIYAGKTLKVPNIVSYKTAKQYYAELEKDKSYTRNQKNVIKRSKLIDYVVSTYKGKMDITGYVTENADLDGENPPVATLELKEKKTNSHFSVFKELLGDKSEYVHDNYMLNVISNEARKLVEPNIQNTFKKKKVQFITKVNISAVTHKQLTERKLKWEYRNVKNQSSTQVFLLLPDTKEYHELALKYLLKQNKSSKIKVSDYDLYFYSGKYDAKIRYVRVNSAKLKKFDTMKELVSNLKENNSLLDYKNDTRFLVMQTKIYK